MENPSIETTTLEDLEDLLQENLKLTKENHKLLKAMRRDAIVGGIVKMLVWVVLIVASFYLSAKFLEPYLGMMGGASGAQDGQAQDFTALFEEYRALLQQ